MKWLIMVFVLMAQVVIAADSGTARGIDPNALKANVWVRFNPVFEGAEDKHVAVGWNKLVYDAKGKRLLMMDRWEDSVRGRTIYANAILALDPVSGRGEMLKVTNYRRQSKKGGGYRTVPIEGASQDDPTPVDRHPYGCFVWSEADNSIYLGPGANRTWKRHPSDFWRFDLETRKWHAQDPSVAGLPVDPKRKTLESVMCYHHAARTIVFHNARNNSTWLYFVDEGKWRKSGCKQNPKAGMGAAMAYDSKRELVYIFGGPGSAGKRWNTPGGELWAFSVKEDTWKRLADSPVPARIPGLAYNSRHDVLLASIGRSKEPAVMMVYDPESDTWSRLQAPAPGSGPAGSGMRLCYDKANDCFVLMSGGYNHAQWWALRYEPTEGVKTGR